MKILQKETRIAKEEYIGNINNNNNKTVQGSVCWQTFSKPELLKFKKSYTFMNVTFSNKFE